MKRFLIALTRNPISLLGAAITTVAAILIATLFGIEIAGFVGNPYVGILAYLILPAIFLFGLILIPIGIWRERRAQRKRRAAGGGPLTYPVINLNLQRTRNWVLIFIVLSAVNLVVLAVATFKGVEHMESVEFCGETCHTVMEPEATAYVGSPHSRVACVDCHIGPGADWFVKSKLSGAWQVVSATFDLYDRPIEAPIHDLRPARETCEQCHWPTKFVGERMQVRTKFASDESNTELKTVLLMRIGGQLGDASHGIHWHVDPDVEIRYLSDPSREEIEAVQLKREDGTIDLYLADGSEADGSDTSEWRVMDCVDCHNRPTHIYRTPERAVDEAFADGRLPRELPWLRREAIELLQAGYESHEEASEAIAAGISAHYAELPGHAEQIAQAGRALGEIYATNVFPEMKVDWNTYLDHIGHEQSPGCFRCHSYELSTADGRTIEQDCDQCHSILAIEESEPEVLATLGL